MTAHSHWGYRVLLRFFSLLARTDHFLWLQWIKLIALVRVAKLHSPPLLDNEPCPSINTLIFKYVYPNAAYRRFHPALKCGKWIGCRNQFDLVSHCSSVCKEATITHPSVTLNTTSCDFLSPFSSFCLCGLLSTEDLHYQRHCGYRWRKQEQFSGAGCYHHQCEEPASTVGKRQLQRSHTRKHRPGHTHRGMLLRGCTETYGFEFSSVQIYLYISNSHQLLWGSLYVR